MFFFAFVAINAKMRFQTFRKKAGKSVLITKKTSEPSCFNIGGPKRKIGGPIPCSPNSPRVFIFFTFAYHGTEEPWFWDTVGSLSFNNYVIFASPPLFSQFLIMFDTLAYIRKFNMCMFWCKFNFFPIFFRVFLHNLGDYLGIRHVPCGISIPKRGKSIPSTPHTLGIQFRQPLAASRAAAPCPPPNFSGKENTKKVKQCANFTPL